LPTVSHSSHSTETEATLVHGAQPYGHGGIELSFLSQQIASSTTASKQHRNPWPEPATEEIDAVTAQILANNNNSGPTRTHYFDLCTNISGFSPFLSNRSRASSNSSRSEPERLIMPLTPTPSLTQTYSSRTSGHSANRPRGSGSDAISPWMRVMEEYEHLDVSSSRPRVGVDTRVWASPRSSVLPAINASDYDSDMPVRMMGIGTVTAVTPPDPYRACSPESRSGPGHNHNGESRTGAVHIQTTIEHSTEIVNFVLDNARADRNGISGDRSSTATN